MSSSERVSHTAHATRRVLVVDDSAFMRRLVSDVVQSSGEFEVVGTARDGEDALRQVAALDPDLVTLDVDMPGLDGLGALTRLMREYPRPVVMLSAGTTHGGMDATLRALECGAVDFVRKPSGSISLDLDLVREQLLQALRGAATVHVARGANAGQTAHTANSHAANSHSTRTESALVSSSANGQILARTVAEPLTVVAIAASTGGPAALARVIPQLSAFPDVAVIVVQHMPAGFTSSFARRLDGTSRLRVAEAVSDEPLRAGHVYVAPGGWHLRVRGPREHPRLALTDDAPQWGVRPAADILFASVAEVYGPNAVGVVMTGMGRDGADGLKQVRDAGGGTIVQDASTSIIPGMPDAARRALGSDHGVPLDELATAIEGAVRQLRAQRGASAATTAPIASAGGA
ncbi:MAG: chemotaxis response regulator protein-glutamate methylesterase [Gemmatimonadaceae bacterium]|nr:chemotaxis response regulator protein-glutamate methylesterase [Gemmatimonadaceae bacterium]